MNDDVRCAILDTIPPALNESELLRRLHADDSFVFMDDLRGMLREAEALARPKGCCLLAAVEHTGDSTVTLDGVAFTSRVLRVNLDGQYRAFPFLATCGRELEAWSHSMTDPMQRFWADAIREMALGNALQALAAHVASTWAPGELATMNPGSLSDWPIKEQRPLFSLFGDAAAAIGVALTDSCLMSPIKSVSGVWFSARQGFVNCQLCPRSDCPNRRTPHDPHLLELRYR